MITSAAMKQAALVRVARNMVGVNASNTEIVNRMRRATDNKAEGEPWCACFVQWAVREVDAIALELGAPVNADGAQRLPPTESTQQLWASSLLTMRSANPTPGTIAVWRLDKDHSRGHCGIVVGTGTNGEVVTVEGNTSMAGASGGNSEAERNGNGIWVKRRAAGVIPGFTLLGYLRSWL